MRAQADVMTTTSTGAAARRGAAAPAPPLHPTKTRLELLRRVDRGEVVWYPRFSLGDDTEVAADTYWNGVGAGSCVTARISEMDDTGWVELGPQHFESTTAPRSWQLTDAGREALEADHV